MWLKKKRKERNAADQADTALSLANVEQVISGRPEPIHRDRETLKAWSMSFNGEIQQLIQEYTDYLLLWAEFLRYIFSFNS